MTASNPIILSLILGTVFPTFALAQDGGASMYRFPDISKNEIVFA